MSTRALYTFRPNSEHETSWNVYKHHDGYPSGAAQVLRDAIDWFAWPLPRYESNEFAAAFVAAAKAFNLIRYAKAKTAKKRKDAAIYLPNEKYGSCRGGGVRLMPQGDPSEVWKLNCSDIEYRYEIMMGIGNSKLIIKAIRIDWKVGTKEERAEENIFFYGPFEDFERGAEKLDELPAGYSIYAENGRRKRKAPLIPHEHTGRVA